MTKPLHPSERKRPDTGWHHSEKTRKKISQAGIKARANTKKGRLIKCEVCSKEFYQRVSILIRNKTFCCSRKCNLALRKSQRERVKTSKGYIKIKQPEHLYCDNKNYVTEHRLVLEKKIGRHLEPHEIVHHINSKRDDNRPDNLYLCQSTKEHMRLHKMDVKLVRKFNRLRYKNWDKLEFVNITEDGFDFASLHLHQI